jgi:hypothetical protein
MDRYPITQTITFTVLATVGIGLAVVAPELAGEARSVAFVAVGGAMFGGSLAFFLSELFRWDRDRTLA